VAALAVAPALADWDHPVKWDQLGPLASWAGASFICYDNNCYAQTADDFLCTGDPFSQYITDVEFYGWSYYGGNNYVDAFRITFWTDVPATPDDESHPGDLLLECDVGYDYVGENHFKVNLPEDCWFDQGVGEEVVYWVGIQAIMTTDGYPDYFYWQFLEPGYGWNDDAAFTATCWNYPPWYNWGWMTPDAPGLYDGPFPDGWYASADMSFRLTGIPEPASLCLLGLGALLLRRR
jgi:hypothetical protein